jgi:4-hydroxybenzoate polyprenyltransferase
MDRKPALASSLQTRSRDMTIETKFQLPFERVLHISRPRFWAYEAGTFAIGAMLALRQLEYPLLQITPITILFLFYFIFPANLLIYGVNDIFDYETDSLNPKKVKYEALVLPQEHQLLFQWIALTNLPFLLPLIFIPFEAILAFAVFLFCAIFYSAWPIRAKVRPVLDTMFSAGHYVATGVFGYYLAGGESVNWLVVIAGMFWCMAMHAYSAVPDIDADTKSGIDTVATLLGEKPTLFLCMILFSLAAALTWHHMGALSPMLGIVYAVLVIVSIFAKTPDKLFRYYKYFPILNLAVGFMIFLTLAVLQRYSWF